MNWPLKYFEYLVTHLRCPQFLLVKPKPNLFVGVDINAVVQKKWPNIFLRSKYNSEIL